LRGKLCIEIALHPHSVGKLSRADVSDRDGMRALAVSEA
jgi:hypothetical protein